MGWVMHNLIKGLHNFLCGKFFLLYLSFPNYKLNKLNSRTVFNHLRGLGVLSCRSLLFCFQTRF